MTKSLVNEWVKLIRPLFPKNARIEIDDSGAGIILGIDWKLGNDPARPNKRSRLIRVSIPRETIEDCTDIREAGSKFKKLIEDKLALFRPDHDTPRCGTRPNEEWTVSTLVIKR